MLSACTAVMRNRFSKSAMFAVSWASWECRWESWRGFCEEGAVLMREPVLVGRWIPDISEGFGADGIWQFYRLRQWILQPERRSSGWATMGGCCCCCCCGKLGLQVRVGSVYPPELRS